MNTGQIGTVERPNDDSPSRCLERLREGKAEHVRLVLQAGTHDLRDWSSALADLAVAPELLIGLTPDLTALDAFLEQVETLVDVLVARTPAIELNLTPDLASVWDVEIDLDELAAVLDRTADAVRRRGLRVLWGLRSPFTEQTLASIERRQLVHDADALLLDVTGSKSWRAWGTVLRGLRTRWDRDRVWLAAGLSKDATRSAGELEAHVHALGLDAPRLYWEASGELLRLWSRGGPGATRRLLQPTRVSTLHEPRPPEATAHDRVLVTGGAGFVGCNLAARLLEQGSEVVVLDNLERDGVERNLEWLRTRWGSHLHIVFGDVRDSHAVRHALEGVGRVFHLAGQVAVTSSLADPVKDFEINARGTLNVLEEVRRLSTPPGVVFTSTNKVYGNLHDVALQELGKRYLPIDLRLRSHGVDESRSLDLHSPYGCSKGTGDQYMLDYAKSYGIPAVVFRMSCIYGPRQFGNEDQGWVAHFFRQALDGRPITIYGDGKQVRDILFVDDLVEAFLAASSRIDALRGRAFNIGGGPENAVSLLELLDWIDGIHGHRPRTDLAPWRRGDQRYYVSDTGRFSAATGWMPTVGVEHGLQRLYGWLRELAAHDEDITVQRSSTHAVPAETRTDP